MASQAASEFALHVRAILGLPVPHDADGRVPLLAPGASAVVLGDATVAAPSFSGLGAALAVDPSVQVRLFGKPEATPGRRLGVALAVGEDVDEARRRAVAAAAVVTVGG